MSVFGSVLGAIGSGVVSGAAGAAASSGGGDGFWGSLASGVGSYFSSGSGWKDLLGGVMGGLSQSAQWSQDEKNAAAAALAAQALEGTRGLENRRTSLFEAQLKDYLEQKEKHDKRQMAIDTYGQFSVLDRRSPGYVPPPRQQAPALPRIEDV